MTIAPFTAGTLTRDGDAVTAEITDCWGTVQRFGFRRVDGVYVLAEAAVVFAAGLRIPFLDDDA